MKSHKLHVVKSVCFFFGGGDASWEHVWNDLESPKMETYYWWKKPGVYQLRLVVYPVIDTVLYIPGG